MSGKPDGCVVPPDVYEWRACLFRSDLPSTRRWILCYLSLRADREPDADGDWSCFPTARRISDDTGVSKRTVLGHLDEAEDDGWVERESAGHVGQGWKRKKYNLTVPLRCACPGGGEVSSPRRGEGGEVVTEGGEADARRGEATSPRSGEGGEVSSPHTFQSVLPLIDLPAVPDGGRTPARENGEKTEYSDSAGREVRTGLTEGLSTNGDGTADDADDGPPPEKRDCPECGEETTWPEGPCPGCRSEELMARMADEDGEGGE